MRSTKIRKDRQNNSSRGAQFCWCSIDTVHNSARAQSIRCEVVLVLNRPGAQFHSCAIESCLAGGALLTSCWILSCLLSRKTAYAIVPRNRVHTLCTCTCTDTSEHRGTHLYLWQVHFVSERWCKCRIFGNWDEEWDFSGSKLLIGAPVDSKVTGCLK